MHPRRGLDQVWTRYRAGDMGADADPDEVPGPERIDQHAEAALAELGA